MGLELRSAAEGRDSPMNQEIQEMTRRGALAAVGSWRELGCEYVSIVDGVPRPWDPKAVALIDLEAQQRGVEVLSLTNDDHVESILAAIVEYVERSLQASQTAAELRKVGATLAPGGSA
jgi:hypothetical protein